MPSCRYTTQGDLQCLHVAEGFQGRWVVMVTTCNKNRHRWNAIRNATRGLPVDVVFVVGDRRSPAYDANTRELRVPCDDTYDDLVHKVIKGVKAVCKLFDPDFVVKMDDDVVLNPRLLRDLVGQPPPGLEYFGLKTVAHGRIDYALDRYTKPQNKVPMVLPEPVAYCGGPMYALGRRAAEIIVRHGDPDAADMRYEDLAIGRLLGKHSLRPSDFPLYTDDKATFDKGTHVAWHAGQAKVVDGSLRLDDAG